MIPQTFIFIGRSGSGKGTQAKLLQQYLSAKDSSTPIFYLQTGEEFRRFIKGDSYTQKLSAELYADGALQPDFLAIYMWAKAFTENLKGGEHMIIDGTPRKLHEAGVLHSIFSFYKRAKPFVIFMNVSEEEAAKRLAARKRMDDDAEEVKKRLHWYQTDVVPAIDFFRNHPDYHFCEINGQQSEDGVHKEVIAAFEASASINA